MNPATVGVQIPGVTGVILAGGKSSRMGSDKALLPYCGGRFIEAIIRQLSELFIEVLVVTNSPEQYSFLPCRKVADIFPGFGVLAGLHSGLYHSNSEHVFAVACDMPYLNSALIRRLVSLRWSNDVVIPESGKGVEPLHALYSRRCLEPMTAAMAGGARRIISFFPEVRVRTFSRSDVAMFDPAYDSFRNINTPAEYFQLRKGEQGEIRPCITGTVANQS